MEPIRLNATAREILGLQISPDEIAGLGGTHREGFKCKVGFSIRHVTKGAALDGRHRPSNVVLRLQIRRHVILAYATERNREMAKGSARADCKTFIYCGPGTKIFTTCRRLLYKALSAPRSITFEPIEKFSAPASSRKMTITVPPSAPKLSCTLSC